MERDKVQLLLSKQSNYALTIQKKIIDLPEDVKGIILQYSGINYKFQFNRLFSIINRYYTLDMLLYVIYQELEENIFFIKDPERQIKCHELFDFIEMWIIKLDIIETKLNQILFQYIHEKEKAIIVNLWALIDKKYKQVTTYKNGRFLYEKINYGLYCPNFNINQYEILGTKEKANEYLTNYKEKTYQDILSCETYFKNV